MILQDDRKVQILWKMCIVQKRKIYHITLEVLNFKHVSPRSEWKWPVKICNHFSFFVIWTTDFFTCFCASTQRYACFPSWQSLLVFHLRVLSNEYHGQSKRYKWHIANVSIIPGIETFAMCHLHRLLWPWYSL